METSVNDNILSLISKTSDLLLSDIAQRVKQRQLEKGWTQKALEKHNKTDTARKALLEQKRQKSRPSNRGARLFFILRRQ